MKWTPKLFKEILIGHEFTNGHCLMFFGNRQGSPEAIQNAYPNLEFRFLTQVHGTQCIESQRAPSEADSHYTDEKNLALCIRTADCAPILVGSEARILAIHAGWRGVFNEILPVSLKRISGSLSLAVGPHIQKESFQVDPALGSEFADKFGAQFFSGDTVDLRGILLNQLELSEAQIQELWCSETDSLRSKEYFSHRAEPDNKGRNISFVARL